MPQNEIVTVAGRRALWAAAIGYGVDGFDLLILSFMLQPIAADLAISTVRAATLVTATLIGAVVGGVAFGALSDRLGRIRVLSWTILVFAIATGLCAISRGYWDLLAYRIVAGLGLGGEFGIGMALAAESWPAARRARASSFVGLGWQAGVLTAALATALLLPAIGWRGMFAIGILPALFAAYIRRSLHDPMVVSRDEHRPTIRRSLGLLIEGRATIRHGIGLLILCSVQNFCYFGVMIWLPGYLASHFGFALGKSMIWTIATIVGMAAGIAVFGEAADRIRRRPTFLVYMAGAAIMVFVYARADDPATLLVEGPVLGFFVNGMLGGYGALISELYPTAARATAQNLLFNVGRAVGGLGPVIVAAIATSYGFPAAVGLFAGLYLIDMLALVLLVPERRGVALA